MNTSNEGDNLILDRDLESIDSANKSFYSRFPYPWPPMTFPRLEDSDFEAVMLNQSVGDFTHRTIPSDGRIWVAGCGTNQAVYTALRFPRATILGSDLSPASLEISSQNAKTLGITNLKLREESINQVRYDEEFDYILCTGVIHHNANPARPLANITRALRKSGVLELMVYNRFHRIFTAALQKAVRLVARFDGATPTYEDQLKLAKAFIASEPLASRVALNSFRDSHESYAADALIQPVEHSYTIDSLNALVNSCGLCFILPCHNQFDVANNRLWTMRFSTSDLQKRIDLLPDIVRWEIVNSLLLDAAPMLWFFLRHRENSTDGRFEARTNEDFLDRRFTRASTTLRNYVRQSTELNYKLSARAVPYPQAHFNDLIRDAVNRSDGNQTMRQLLDQMAVDTSDQKTVTDIRVQTTTSQWPYLRAL